MSALYEALKRAKFGHEIMQSLHGTKATNLIYKDGSFFLKTYDYHSDITSYEMISEETAKFSLTSRYAS